MNSIKLTNFPMLSDIVPINWLLESLKLCSSSNSYISLLIPPSIILECKSIFYLDVYIGLGCAPSTNKNHVALLTSTLFCHAAASATIKNNSDNEIDVLHDSVAYLFECCYDLMLSAASNVSVNPGFERFAGQH